MAQQTAIITFQELYNTRQIEGLEGEYIHAFIIDINDKKEKRTINNIFPNTDGTPFQVTWVQGNAINDLTTFNDFFKLYKKNQKKPITEETANKLDEHTMLLINAFNTANLVLVAVHPEKNAKNYILYLTTIEWLQNNRTHFIYKQMDDKANIIFPKNLPWPLVEPIKDITLKEDVQTQAEIIPSNIEGLAQKLSLSLDEIKRDQRRSDIIDIDDLQNLIERKLLTPSQLTDISHKLDNKLTMKDGIAIDTYTLYKNVINEELRGNTPIGKVFRKQPVKRNIGKKLQTITSN